MSAQERKPMLVILLLLALISFRFIPFFIEVPEHVVSPKTPLYQVLFGLVGENKHTALIFSTISMLLTSFIAHLVFNKLWVYESRSTISVLIFAILLSSGGYFQLMDGRLFLPFVLLLVFFTLFGNEEERITPLRTYNLSLLIALGSLFDYHVLYLLPVFLGIQIYTRDFSFKTLWATISALATAYWILIAILLIIGQPELFLSFFKSFSFGLIDFSEIPEGYYVYIPGLSLMALLAFANFSRDYAKMKQSTRVVFLSANILAVYVLVLALFGLLPIFHAIAAAVVPFTLLFTYYYNNARTKVLWIFFPSLLLFMLISFIDKF